RRSWGDESVLSPTSNLQALTHQIGQGNRQADKECCEHAHGQQSGKRHPEQGAYTTPEHDRRRPAAAFSFRTGLSGHVFLGYSIRIVNLYLLIASPCRPIPCRTAVSLVKVGEG